MVVSHVPLVGDLACNLGMCPEWEWNRQPCLLCCGAVCGGGVREGMMWLTCSPLAPLSIELSHVSLGVSPVVATPAVIYS